MCDGVSVSETLGRCKPRYCNAIPHAMRWEILLSGKPEMGISSESHPRPPPPPGTWRTSSGLIASTPSTF